MKNKRNFLIKFISEAYQELKKVVWPKRSEVVKKTIIVVVSMVVIAALIGFLDYGLSQGVQFLINLK
jgi:preprotein translocase subunit SecE